jgi:hypothetical protein
MICPAFCGIRSVRSLNLLLGLDDCQTIDIDRSHLGERNRAVLPHRIGVADSRRQAAGALREADRRR